ncbi:MAG: ARMT1-like domain-containing protein [Desulfurococcales archaeon]|nr:ARMT1-like domain-containing protein [Desulfurococcales archaeon]
MPVETPWDPVECLECILHARPGLGRDEARVMIARDRTRAFVETYARLAGGGDPLRGLKDRLNRGVKELAAGLEPQDYEHALRLMATANGVDWGMRGHKYTLEDLVTGRGVVWIPGVDPVVEAVEGSRRIALLLDNAGEAVIDVAVAGWLARRGHEVTLVAREEPYEVDVTYREAGELVESLGVEGVRLVSTGSRYPAPHPMASTMARRILMESDLVLSKGIANYEAATENPGRWRIVFLLRAKCGPIARQYSVARGTPLVVAGFTL